MKQTQSEKIAIFHLPIRFAYFLLSLTNALFFLGTSKIEVQSGSSYFFRNFEAGLFFLCS